jgi:alkaline phosphatase
MKSLSKVILTCLGFLFFFSSVRASPTSALLLAGESPPAVILYIGDGMGAEHRKAGRWSSVGMGGSLNMDDLAASGWSKTMEAEGKITDSAAAATAIATGKKTYKGRVSVSVDGKALPTILEYAQRQGMAVGLVTNVPLAHATPAAFAAHELSRYAYTNIALQMAQHQVEVLLGGGESDFLPVTETGCHPDLGYRTDGRNLISEAVAAGYTHICDTADLGAVDLENTTHLLGTFADDGMPRPFEPSLEEMTAAAIAILSNDPEGFFLMVEGGQIDWAAHANIGEDVIGDVLGLDAAVGLGLDYGTTNPNALVIITADHETGGMSVNLTSSGLGSEDGPFLMPDDTVFYINWTTGGHTGADVPVTATGFRAETLNGTYENTHIYYSMHSVFGWEVLAPLLAR